MGAARFPQARKLMITADGGGSNGSSNRPWKVALRELADEPAMTLYWSDYQSVSGVGKVHSRFFGL